MMVKITKETGPLNLLFWLMNSKVYSIMLIEAVGTGTT